MAQQEMVKEEVVQISVGEVAAVLKTGSPCTAKYNTSVNQGRRTTLFEIRGDGSVFKIHNRSITFRDKPEVTLCFVAQRT